MLHFSITTECPGSPPKRRLWKVSKKTERSDTVGRHVKDLFFFLHKKEKRNRTTGRRTRYTLCKSVLSNRITCIFAFSILCYIDTGDEILCKHMCITIIRRHYHLVGGFIPSFPFFKEEYERVYVCLSVFLFAFRTKLRIFTNYVVGIMVLEKTPLWISDPYNL